MRWRADIMSKTTTASMPYESIALLFLSAWITGDTHFAAIASLTFCIQSSPCHKGKPYDFPFQLSDFKHLPDHWFYSYPAFQTTRYTNQPRPPRQTSFNPASVPSTRLQSRPSLSPPHPVPRIPLPSPPSQYANLVHAPHSRTHVSDPAVAGSGDM